ncbi:MAG: exodeoxyribonuclease III [Hellea sp.]|nr:exodeoxyribonuclease III [Hellea sp.]
MTIATWNVNSIRTRMHAVTKWLKEADPDVVCLQEIKAMTENFPFMEIEALGYNIEILGQKSYNGVAILSKRPFDEISKGLPGDETDEQARYIEAVIAGENGPFRVATIYLPNGNPAPGPKYDYKLDWMDRLKVHAKGLLKFEEPIVLAGDYNVIPEEKDVYAPKEWLTEALFLPQTRSKFREILNLGYTEAFEQMDGRAGQYTFWDYQRGAWQNNEGIRIDHLLLSPQAADKIVNFEIHKATRDGIKPSDHVPVVGIFDL